MNDLEKLQKTLTEIGCPFEWKTSQEVEGKTPAEVDYSIKVVWDTVLSIDEGAGYGGFYCNFYFLDGKFQNHACWE